MPKKNVVTKVKNPPTRQKILSMLDGTGVTKKKVCEQLAVGLMADKAVVVDGEIFYVPDIPTRHKFIETILDVLGEKKLIIPDGELHIHFTNILQQVRAYERGDTRAVKDADKFLEASGGDSSEA